MRSGRSMPLSMMTGMLHVWAASTNCRQIEKPSTVREPQVEDHQRRHFLPGQGQAGLPGVGRQRLVALLLEPPREEFDQGLIVVDNEDRVAAGRFPADRVRVGRTEWRAWQCSFSRGTFVVGAGACRPDCSGRHGPAPKSGPTRPGSECRVLPGGSPATLHHDCRLVKLGVLAATTRNAPSLTAAGAGTPVR